MRAFVCVGALSCWTLLATGAAHAGEDFRSIETPTNRRAPSPDWRPSTPRGGTYDHLETFEQYDFDAHGVIFESPFEIAWIASDFASAVHLDPGAPAPIALYLAKGDVSGDGVVTMADLGLVAGAFGTMGGPSDVNGDGVVNTADLGLVLRYFGQTIEEIEPGLFGWCQHQALTAADALRPGDIVTLPFDQSCFGQSRFVVRDPETGNDVATGDWALEGIAVSPAPSASVAALPLILPEDNQCLVMLPNGEGGGGAATYALGEFLDVLGPFDGEPVVLETDMYLGSHARMVWLDTRSTCEGFTAMRMFLGGTFGEFGPDFLPFLDNNLELDRFTFLASRIGEITSGVIYGTGEDLDAGATGKRIMLHEWFRVRLVMHENTMEFWVRDSETEQLPPGTPFTTEDGFARIFPGGPYGPAIGSDKGDVAVDPQPLLAANSMTGMRCFANERVNDPWAIDNVRITGPRIPQAEVGPLPDELVILEPYVDGFEGYHLDLLSRQSCDRWFETALAGTGVVEDEVFAGERAATQENTTGDFIYRTMFRTFTPDFFETEGQDVVYRCRMRLSDCRTLRGFTVIDRDLFENVSLLTGYYDDFGAIPVDEDGLSEFWIYDWFNGAAIPTGVRVPAVNEWFECEILLRGFADPFFSPPAHIEVRVNGEMIYSGDWANTYGGVISFDSDNHPAGVGSRLWVDDVSVRTQFTSFPAP